MDYDRKAYHAATKILDEYNAKTELYQRRPDTKLAVDAGMITFEPDCDGEYPSPTALFVSILDSQK